MSFLVAIKSIILAFLTFNLVDSSSLDSRPQLSSRSSTTSFPSGIELEKIFESLEEQEEKIQNLLQLKPLSFLAKNDAYIIVPKLREEYLKNSHFYRYFLSIRNIQPRSPPHLS